MSFSTANASISASSVVPGLPNTTSTPSCLRISRNARFPEMTGKVSSACFGESSETLFPQQILVLAAEHQFAVLVMDGRGHHHNAGRALRDQRRDGVRGIKRVARID